MSEEQPSFNNADYEIIKKETLYTGIFHLLRYHLRYKLYDGSWSSVVERELVERLSAAAVLPYDPLLDQVILIEQIRPGAFSHPISPWLVEIVAGCLDTDESPDMVASREALEEANCLISNLCLITDYFVSPGCSNEYLHLYCAKVDATNSGGVYGLAEEQENIRAFTIPAEEAFKQVREGKIKTAPAIISLLWLELNRPALRKKWLEN